MGTSGKGIWNFKGSQIVKTILEKNKAGGLTRPNLKTYYKAIVTKTLWHQHKDKMWLNRKKNPEVNFQMYGQLIFDKGTKTIQWGGDSLSNKWCEGKLDIHRKRMNWPLQHTTYKHELKMDQRLGFKSQSYKHSRKLLWLWISQKHRQEELKNR